MLAASQGWQRLKARPSSTEMRMGRNAHSVASAMDIWPFLPLCVTSQPIIATEAFPATPEACTTAARLTSPSHSLSQLLGSTSIHAQQNNL